MHIGFFAISPRSRLYYKMAQRIREIAPETTFSAVVTSPRATDDARSLPPGLVEIVDMPGAIAKRWSETQVTREAIADMERRYGDPHLSKAWNADRVISRWPQEDAQRLILLQARFWEEYADRYRPDVVLCGGVAHLASYLGHRVLTTRGHRFATLGVAKTKRRFYLSDRLEPHHFDGLDEAIEDISKNGLPAAEAKEAERFVQDITTTRSTYVDEKKWKWRTAVPAIVPRTLPRFLRKAVADMRDPRVADSVRAGTMMHPMRAGWQRTSNALTWRRARMARIFERPPAKPEPYVFYGLHFQPEATTLVNGQFFIDQPALIANIARSIPLTHKLYVKEHRVNVGSRPMVDYRRILAIPNVRLLGPHEPTHALIEKADLVVSIASTIGWEAILYRRPLVVLGDVFYDRYSEARKVTDLTELPGTIRDLLMRGAPSHDSLVAFVAAVLRTTHPGLVYNPRADTDTLEAENVDAVCRAVLAFASRKPRSR